MDLNDNQAIKTTWRDLSPTKGRLVPDIQDNRILQIKRHCTSGNMNNSSILTSSLPINCRSMPLSVDSLNASGTDNLTTWKQLSPPKERKFIFKRCIKEKATSLKSNPKRSRTWPRMKSNQNQCITWRDLSPTKRDALLGSLCKHDKHKRDSGYISNGTSRQSQSSRISNLDLGTVEIQGFTVDPDGNALNISPEDTLNNEYFYDEDFAVQFDTNIRDSIMEGSALDPDLLMRLSQMSGCYRSFSHVHSSYSEHGRRSSQYGSEMSSERNSMEISMSDRDMMCSSIELNSEPLFTPTPTNEAAPSNYSVDSLSLDRKVAMTSSRGSAEVNLRYDCGPKKENYYLSFGKNLLSEGSVSSQESYSNELDGSQSCSNDTGCSQSNEIFASQSCSSVGEDGEEVCSDSFHFCTTKVDSGYQAGSPRYQVIKNTKPPTALSALSEQSSETSTFSSSKMSQRLSSASPRKLFNSFKSSSSSFGSHYGQNPSSSSSFQKESASSNMASWKDYEQPTRSQPQNASRKNKSTSMPDLSVSLQTWQRVASERKRHKSILSNNASCKGNKRYSASLLELFQRMKQQSNPASPESPGDQQLWRMYASRDGSLDSSECHSGPSRRGAMYSSSDDDGLLKYTPEKHSYRGRCRSAMDDTDRRKKAPRGSNSVPRSLALGYASDKMSKGTAISPHNVTLFAGTKNFSAQFPPNTRDCGIQTSTDEKNISKIDQGFQTSPQSSDQDYFQENVRLRRSASVESRGTTCACQHRTRSHSRLDKPEKVHVHRAMSMDERSLGHGHRPMSMDETRLGHNCLSVGSGMFYSYRSLPDLSFLKVPSFIDGSESIFDGSSHSSILQAKKTTINKPPQRQCMPSSSMNNGRKFQSKSIDSNSSIFSTSSTSSGIDPGSGYSDAHASWNSANNFLDPENRSGTFPRRSMSKARREQMVNEKFEKYVCEHYPGPSVMPSLFPRKPMTCHHRSESFNGSGCVDPLYSLLEERTPTSSPDQDACDHLLTNRQQFIQRGQHTLSHGKRCCRNWGSEVEELNLLLGADIFSAATLPEIVFEDESQLPLKSCLRKRAPNRRSKSLTDPQSLNSWPCSDDEREDVRSYRHSYACDDFAEHLAISNEAPAEMVLINHAEHNSTDHDDTADSSITQVEMEDSLTESDSDKGEKRVSFASEVSFRSPKISPHASPKRLASQRKSEEAGTFAVQTNGSKGSIDTQAPPGVFKIKAQERLLTPADLDEKRALLSQISKAVESLVNHFAQSKLPFDKIRLGNSTETPAVGDIVHNQLCPVVRKVISDGLRPYMAGFHVFGKIHVSVWRVAEESAELGPATRSVHELVNLVKSEDQLHSNQQKFDAFICGLLNMRLLDFWIDNIKIRPNIIDQLYEPTSAIYLANTILREEYEEMTISLQPLAILPFQLEYSHVTMNQPTTVDCNSNTTLALPEEPQVNEVPSLASRFADEKQRNQLGTSAAKAWNWISKSTQKIQEEAASKISQFGKNLSTKSGSVDNLKYENHEDGEYRPRSVGSLLGTDTDGKTSDAIGGIQDGKDKKASKNKDLNSKAYKIMVDNEFLSDGDHAENPAYGAKENSSPRTSLKKKIFKQSKEKSAYKKGVTEYSFDSVLDAEEGDAKENEDDVEETSEQLGDENIVDPSRKVMAGSDPSTPTAASAEYQTTVKPKSVTTSAKAASFDVINFFDKLLLPQKQDKIKSRWSWTQGVREKLSPSRSTKDMHNRQSVSAEPSCKQTDTNSTETDKAKVMNDQKTTELSGDIAEAQMPGYGGSRDGQPLVRDSSRDHLMAFSSDSCADTYSAEWKEQTSFDLDLLGSYPPPDSVQECDSEIPRVNGLDSSVEEMESLIEQEEMATADDTNQQATNATEEFRATEYKYVQTLTSHDATESDHMSFEAGEVLEVLAQIDSDWLFCADGVKEGFVPISDIKSVYDADLFDHLHSDFYS